jgi:Uma2 family endonuclease
MNLGASVHGSVRIVRAANSRSTSFKQDCVLLVSTLTPDTAPLHVPDWVVDLASFRTWVHSPEVPEKTRAFYLAGEVVVDMTTEQYFWHNQLKQEFNGVIGPFVKANKLGRYSPDGMLITSTDADLSSRPDGVFVSIDSFKSGRVVLVEAAKKGFVELLGSPDLVIEVVSDGSVRKDTVRLRDLYWRAGIREYWLADARNEPLSFEIMTSTERGFVEVADESGWKRSNVLGKEFRLLQRTDELGDPEYVLEMR